MSWDVALILSVDGLANGAVYLLAGIGLVLIFSVTRVVFVPFGDIAAFAALSLAAFETGRLEGCAQLGEALARVQLRGVHQLREAVRAGSRDPPCAIAPARHPTRPARPSRPRGC